MRTMVFWCHMLRCADGPSYNGHTDDLERRIGQHQAGGSCAFTSRRRPVALVWSQDFTSRLEALEAERRIGSWSRTKEALIAGDWDALSYWAKPPAKRPSTSLGTNGGVEPRRTRGENASPFSSVPSEVGAPAGR